MIHYAGYVHGEAVAVGMSMAARLAEMRGAAPKGTEAVMVKALTALDLPVEPPKFDSETWLDVMGHDKKNIGIRIRYVLLKGLGEGFIAEDVGNDEIASLIASFDA